MAEFDYSSYLGAYPYYYAGYGATNPVQRAQYQQAQQAISFAGNQQDKGTGSNLGVLALVVGGGLALYAAFKKGKLSGITKWFKGNAVQKALQNATNPKYNQSGSNFLKGVNNILNAKNLQSVEKHADIKKVLAKKPKFSGVFSYVNKQGQTIYEQYSKGALKSTVKVGNNRKGQFQIAQNIFKNGKAIGSTTIDESAITIRKGGKVTEKIKAVLPEKKAAEVAEGAKKTAKKPVKTSGKKAEGTPAKNKSVKKAKVKGKVKTYPADIKNLKATSSSFDIFETARKNGIVLKNPPKELIGHPKKLNEFYISQIKTEYAKKHGIKTVKVSPKKVAASKAKRAAAKKATNPLAGMSGKELRELAHRQGIDIPQGITVKDLKARLATELSYML